MVLLKRLLKEKRMKQKDFAQLLGVDETTVSLISNGFRPMPDEMRRALDEMFGADFVAKYEVQKFTEPTQVTATILPSGIVEEVEERVRQQISHPKREDVEIIEAEEVPIISQDIARMPNIDIFSAVKSGELDVQRKTYAEILPSFDAKVYAYSSAMSPVINPGDPMLVRLIPKDSHIIPGEIYLIDTPAGLIARTAKESGDTIICTALNPAYGEVVLPREQIFSIAQVVMVLKRPTNASFQDHILSAAIERRDKQIDNALRIIEKSCDRADRLIEEFILRK